MKSRLVVALILSLVLSVAGFSAERDSIGPAEFYWLLSRACAYDDELSVSMLLRAGADPSGLADYPKFHAKYKRGYEPTWHLIMAARLGHLSIVRQLLEAGALPNLIEGEGVSALTVAAANGHREVVELLLQYGADRNYRTPAGTAATLAERAGHKEIADLLRGSSQAKPDDGPLFPEADPQTIPPPEEE